MPVVTNTITDPGGQPVGDTLVRIVLGGGLGDGGYVTGGDYSLFGRLETRTQGDGTWRATLLANSLITDPLGSFYQIHEFRRGDRVSHAYHISVPEGGGPYWAPGLLGGDLVMVGGWVGAEHLLIGPDP